MLPCFGIFNRLDVSLSKMFVFNNRFLTDFKNRKGLFEYILLIGLIDWPDRFSLENSESVC